MHTLTNQGFTSRLRRSPAQAGLAAMVATAGVLGLCGCEQHPYPSPAPEETSSAPTPPTNLMGAPEGNTASQGDAPPGPASDGRPAYGAGPYAQAQPYPGPSGAAPPSYAPPDQPARPPCPPDPTFKGPNAPSVIICNAPVPNPPEDAHATPRRRHMHWRRHHYFWAGAAPVGEHHRWTHHRRRYGAAVSATPIPSAPPVSTAAGHHGHALAAAPSVRPIHRRRHPLAAPPHMTLAPIPAVPVPAAPVHPATPHHHRTRPAAIAVPTAASQSAQYSDLQSAWAGEVSRQATLGGPSHFTADQSEDVTLTFPAGFAQTVQADAAAQKLQAETASANLSATLAGEGFTVTPQGTQSQPIAVGQPITFRWKVTPQANAKGPLQAEISADLPSQGRSLSLGAVKSLAGVGLVTGRAVGVGILVVVALLALGWAATRRRRPKPSGALRPRENHLTGI